MKPVWQQLRFRREHRWTQLHMSVYLDADLRRESRARLERHTAQCPECRGVLDELRQMLALLRTAPPPAAVADTQAITSAVLLRLHESAGH
jgi:anti-sigma factor RsiW